MPAVLTNAVPDAQLDGIEFGDPVMMDRQKWAMDMGSSSHKVIQASAKWV